MIVVVTAEAEADLDQIAAYVAERSPQGALNLIHELREKCESLGRRSARLSLGTAL